MSPAFDPEAIQDAVKRRYAQASRCVDNLFRYPTGRAGALQLGYAQAWIEAAPAEMIAGFCGVGNPFVLGPLGPGDGVLDVGCGAGFDLFCAKRLVGLNGRAAGIDLTPEMVARTERSLQAAGITDVEVRQASAAAIPFPDASFTVVISNGVLNLTIDKEKAFSELHRVLKKGGRLQFADVVLARELPPLEMTAVAWSN
jgi:arsenite methyltransferase